MRKIRKVVPPAAPAPDPQQGERVVILGVDPSLIGTAVSAVEDGDIIWTHGWTDKEALQRRHQDKLSCYKLPPSASYSDRLARINLIAGWVVSVVQAFKQAGATVSVAIEGLALSQRSNRASDLAELSGVIKNRLMFGEQVPLRVYEPTTVKSAWTGFGNADKAMMIMTCFRRWRVDFTALEGVADNFADATLLAQLLYNEVAIRAGRISIHDISADLRAVLQKTTKARPVPLLALPLIGCGEVAAKGPTLGGQ